jgi:hypothetical protein
MIWDLLESKQRIGYVDGDEIKQRYPSSVWPKAICIAYINHRESLVIMVTSKKIDK